MRREVGLTQAELAERIGVSRAAVAQWERGYSQPRVVVVERIAEALGVGVGELVSLREVDEGSAETRDDVRWGVPLFAHGAMPLGETLGACVEVPRVPSGQPPKSPRPRDARRLHEPRVSRRLHRGVRSQYPARQR
jgi:transcriptional regulator with XRE-family HTH domain